MQKGHECTKVNNNNHKKSKWGYCQDVYILIFNIDLYIVLILPGLHTCGRRWSWAARRPVPGPPRPRRSGLSGSRECSPELRGRVWRHGAQRGDGHQGGNNTGWTQLILWTWDHAPGKLWGQQGAELFIFLAKNKIQLYKKKSAVRNFSETSAH